MMLKPLHVEPKLRSSGAVTEKLRSLLLEFRLVKSTSPLVVSVTLMVAEKTPAMSIWIWRLFRSVMMSSAGAFGDRDRFP